jgi:3-deoxy-D-manno-octulosonic acid (KDO) 8-phosphate synthase
MTSIVTKETKVLNTHPKPIELAPNVMLGGDAPLLIAGPCVIESAELTLTIAAELKTITARLGIPFVFKASFDKANRTSDSSFRSIGFEAALAVLADVKQTHDLPLLTDVHETIQIDAVADVVDVLQIPAFLCRQTDLLYAAGAGVDGFFIETHPNPDEALSDGPNMIPLDEMMIFLEGILSVWRASKPFVVSL